MTKLRCNPDGYREALNKIRSEPDPVKALCQFYKEAKNMRKGREVFETQFLPFIESHRCERERSLEIGYGPGSLVAEAGKHFRETWGIDVHEARDVVGQFLEENGCYNYQLLISPTGDGIPTRRDNIDFIYSWTVFMHLGKIEVAYKYLQDTYSVLKPGGLAIIYFARPFRSKKHETKEEWEEAIRQEELTMRYRELKGRRIQKINLHIAMWHMVRMCEDIGFKVLEKTASTRRIDGILYYHGQHGVVLRKEHNNEK
jgi:SAM-dependent methyltransferase